MKINTKSKKEVDLPDGNYRGRQGGNIVTIRQAKEATRFEVYIDIGPLSAGVYVEIKDKTAKVNSNGFY